MMKGQVRAHLTQPVLTSKVDEAQLRTINNDNRMERRGRGPSQRLIHDRDRE